MNLLDLKIKNKHKALLFFILYCAEHVLLLLSVTLFKLGSSARYIK